MLVVHKPLYYEGPTSSPISGSKIFLVSALKVRRHEREEFLGAYDAERSETFVSVIAF